MYPVSQQIGSFEEGYSREAYRRDRGERKRDYRAVYKGEQPYCAHRHYRERQPNHSGSSYYQPMENPSVFSFRPVRGHMGHMNYGHPDQHGHYRDGYQ